MGSTRKLAVTANGSIGSMVVVGRLSDLPTMATVL